MTTVLDRGGVLLVRLPKGVLGEETTSLVGSLVLAQAWQAATARAHRPQHARPDASILIDECHNFLNLPYRIEDMLAEARGFRIGLTLAHQNLAQLPPELREGINTNARNKIMFSVSPDDATHLARHTLPELGPHDLAHLDAFHAAARLLHDGAETRAFTLTTRPLPSLRQHPATASPSTRHRGPRRPDRSYRSESGTTGSAPSPQTGERPAATPNPAAGRTPARRTDPRRVTDHGRATGRRRPP